MYARIDEENRVAEWVSFNPQGLYHSSLLWVEVPEWIEPFIDNQFWYDGNTLHPPTEDYICTIVKTRQRALFTNVFMRLEQRAQRPQSAVLAALMDATPVPEPDADFVWQMEAIKEENRLLLLQLEAAQTWEEALECEPWLPWATPQGGI